jgi:hypothetical protein
MLRVLRPDGFSLGRATSAMLDDLGPLVLLKELDRQIHVLGPIPGNHEHRVCTQDDDHVFAAHMVAAE